MKGCLSVEGNTKDVCNSAEDTGESSPLLHYVLLGQPLLYDHFALLKHRNVFERTIPILNQ
jgi:hypothetical protein